MLSISCWKRNGFFELSDKDTVYLMQGSTDDFILPKNYTKAVIQQNLIGITMFIYDSNLSTDDATLGTLREHL